MRILHVEDMAGAPYIVMEYVEGKTLEHWLQDHAGPVSASEVVRAARDLLNALIAAHEKGLIHRDIKPSNVMVEARSGQLKLLDFGLTRSAEPGDEVTEAGRPVGTLRYMSLEQADGLPPDPRSDLFSLGATLYRMVAGRSPCLVGNPVDHDDKPIPTPLPLAGIPLELGQFILRLLERKPADRPADARTALVELEAIERRLDREETATISNPLSRGPRRRVLIATGFAAMVVALVVGVIIIIHYQDGKKIEIDVPDGKLKGVEQVDPKTGKPMDVPLAKAEPKKLEVPGVKEIEKKELRVGSQVIVTANTVCYLAHLGDDKELYVEKGWVGEVVETAEGSNRIRVRFDNQPTRPAWIARDYLRSK